MNTADQICRKTDFLVDRIFVKFEEWLFHQSIGSNCAPLLADLFLYSYKHEVLDSQVRGSHRIFATTT